jgi:hypothetical protein
MPVSPVNRACSAISCPWSQVKDRVSCRGSVVIAAASASAHAVSGERVPAAAAEELPRKGRTRIGGAP